MRLLEAHGLCGSSRLELTSSGVAGGSGRTVAPSEEVLAFARVCALSEDDVVRAADALQRGVGDEGEGGGGREALALSVGEEGRGGLLLLRQAIAEAVGVAGGDVRLDNALDDAKHNSRRIPAAIPGATWRRDVLSQLEAGRHALATAACGWIDESLKS